MLVSHPNINPAEQGLTSVKFSITKLSDAQKAHLWCKEVVRELGKLSTCQPRSQCFSLLFYLLFFRDWNAVFQYHTIQCLLIFCSTYHRQPSVCFTEASRFEIWTMRGTSRLNIRWNWVELGKTAAWHFASVLRRTIGAFEFTGAAKGNDT